MEMQNPGTMQCIQSVFANGHPYILLQTEAWLEISPAILCYLNYTHYTAYQVMYERTATMSLPVFA